MQMNENKSIDARTFPEIWETLTEYQRENLRFAVLVNIRVSPQTFWNWRTGKRRPDFLHRREIAWPGLMSLSARSKTRRSWRT